MAFGAEMLHTEVMKQAAKSDEYTVYPHTFGAITRKETGTRDGVDVEVKEG